ncbi:MAG: NAD(P)/FAD-dependent oxidoreductase [Gammaproteobacteria bacterium]|nr:NAD(P)/FAD-dependent oxidoreductase [Gammaproteobacteria bacterium]
MKRSFKGLRLSVGPEDTYDAVIIGAGIGGLICANLLACNGLRVLLVEQHYMVGGYCSTFRRKGYTFDAATHFYPLLGNPTTITGKLLKDLGITTGWVKMDPVDQFHFPDGSKFSVSADYEIYLAELKAEFPSESQALDRFFFDVRETYRLGLLYYFRGRNTSRLDPYRDLTVRQVLDRYFQDSKLKLLLTADGPHWGAPPCRTSFVFDSMLRLSYFLGNYYPSGGSQVFSDEIAQRFEEKGGHVLTNSLVKRILVKDKTVCGVEIETGPMSRRYKKQIRAEVVISNADQLQTLEQMLGTEHLDPTYMASVRSLRPSYPCFLTHIGLKDISSEVLCEAQGYYWNSWDPDQMGCNGLKFKLFVPTLFEPRMAPPGGHVLIIQKVIDMDYYATDNWASHKTTIEQYIMDNLQQVIPGISEKIVVKTSASALTSYNFTLNYRGAMLGWEMSPDQLGENRTGVVGPIKGLYFTGHWVQPGGGITPVIVSAMQAAEAVLK